MNGQLANAFRPTTCLVVVLAVLPLNAVTFLSTGDPENNTTAPAGALADSGWQFQGLWGAYLGTAISSNAFLTAQHVGGTVGTVFSLQGVAYTTTAFYDDPETDLRIVRVCGIFPGFAVLDASLSEPGKDLVVFGRGTQRGTVVTSGLTNERTNGWRWGVFDNRLRWGENSVDSVVDGDALFETGVGELLKATFSEDGGTNECHLSVGDSGGGLFVFDGSWKLAGINYSVDGPYNTSTQGGGFNATIFDVGGLYEQNGGVWTFVPDLPIDQAGAFYATRVAARMDWINSVLQQIAEETDLPTLQSSTNPAGPFTDHGEAVVDPENCLITLPRPGDTRFYRLRGCQPSRITQIEVVADTLHLAFE